MKQPQHIYNPLDLPNGVNSLLRGQDHSASSHAEWLEQQLGRAAPGGVAPVANPGSASRMGAAGLSSSAAPGAALLARGAHFEATDCEARHAGSPRHEAWLQQQLRGAAARHR